MPCVLKKHNVMGMKVINRNERRRSEGMVNMDSQILLYDYDKCMIKALLDGNYITVVRTAAVAVHTIFNMVDDYSVVSLVGLGNVMNAIGEMWFPLLNSKLVVKVMKYKNHAEQFVERFSKYENIEFRICDSYDELMSDSKLILSAVSFIENDFCDPAIYKKGCTIIPIHVRGFMNCDKVFDNIIVSDMVRIKEFSHYYEMKKITLTDVALRNEKAIRENADDRGIVYNLGLSSLDLYFADKIYKLMEIRENSKDFTLGTQEKYYI